MSATAFVKKYPRALIKKHPNANGWTIDLIQRAGVKPKRVAATYASIPWAHRAAHQKLGLPVSAIKPAAPAATASVAPALPPAAPKPADINICLVCQRPMRRPRAKLADFPGTVSRRRSGLCQGCAMKAERSGQPVETTRLTTDTVVEDVEFLAKTGANREEITVRLGAASWEAIARMLHRADRKDLVELVPPADPEKAAEGRKAHAA